jgi:cobalt-precorrin 5A hydrolase
MTRGGAALAARVVAELPGADLYIARRWWAPGGERSRPFDGPLADIIAHLFRGHRGLVIFAAVGVVVRLVAPCLRNKHIDPAVVAVDDAGRFVVSVVSGHVGGANALATRVAAILGATAVITTASDARGIQSADMLGRELGWRLEGDAGLRSVSAALVNEEVVGLVQDAGSEDWWQGPLPQMVRRFDTLEALAAAGVPGLVITDRLIPARFSTAARAWVVYRPRSLALGIGASTGVTKAEIQALVAGTLAEAGLAAASVGAIGTLDRKLDEPGLVAFAAGWALPVRSYTAEQLARVSVAQPSAVVLSHVGTPSVCEAAARLAAEGGPLVVPKRKSTRATVAIARVLESRSWATSS